MATLEQRPLTHDEHKAAEAAFRGLPLNSAWSPGAQAIYHGIVSATHGRNVVEEAVMAEHDTQEEALVP